MPTIYIPILPMSLQLNDLRTCWSDGSRAGPAAGNEITGLRETLQSPWLGPPPNPSRPKKKKYSIQTLEKPPNSPAPTSENQNSQMQPLSGPKNTPYKVRPIDADSFRDGDVRLADVYGFFYHALPSVGVLTLDELHAVVRDVWLTRHDEELEQERVARRKGRPKSTKEAKIEEIQLRETEEYRTGIGASDLSPADSE